MRIRTHASYLVKDYALSQSDTATQSPPSQTSPRAWIGYVVPMVVFSALTAIEGQPLGIPYPFLYIFKAIVVTATLVMGRKLWKEIVWNPRHLLLGLLVGLAVFVEWIVVDKFTPHFMGKRTAFNPFRDIDQAALRYVFLIVRFYGLVVMVPLMEELFWRSFLIRWLTDPDFKSISMTGWSWSAFGMVAGIFALSHPEWLAAAICAVAYGLLLRKTGSLFSCVVAHAFTNLLLGIYILAAHAYTLW